MDPTLGPAPGSPPLPALPAGGTATAAPPLPLGNNTSASEYAAAIEETPDHILPAEEEKTKAGERELRGEEEKGTVVPGIEDDQLWAHQRAFDKHITHVLSPPIFLPAGEPDLRQTTLPAVPFNSDALKNNFERVYASAGVVAILFAREMRRLMLWTPEERTRTAAFCVAYFISAYYSLAIPLIATLLMTLVLFPRSRRILFPAPRPPHGEPLSATDPTNQKGDETLLSSTEHPAQHRSKAEQIEEQAWEITNIVQRVGVKVIVGGRSKWEGNATVGKKVGKESSESEEESEEEDSSEKGNKKKEAKEAKVKRDAIVGKIGRGAQDGLGDFADAMERWANALSPPSVYPKNFAREKLAFLIFAPIILITALVPAHYWAQGASFAFGIGFFAQPLLIRSAKKFVEVVPDWQERLDLRNTLFSRVPTNAQLVLHLLRVSEAAGQPLPPPPSPPSSGEVKTEMNKTGADLGEGELEPEKREHEEEEEKKGLGHRAAKKGAKKFIGGMQAAAKKVATFGGDVKVKDEGETRRQKVGNKIDRLLYHSRAKDLKTPESFPAKLSGHSGHLLISHSLSSPPILSFQPLSSPSTTTFQAPLADLVEIKKHGVWIGRAVLGWAAATNLEGMGLELRFKEHSERAVDGLGKGEVPHEETHEGVCWEFSHVARRDELFDRLVSVGEQKWESL